MLLMMPTDTKFSRLFDINIPEWNECGAASYPMAHETARVNERKRHYKTV